MADPRAWLCRKPGTCQKHVHLSHQILSDPPGWHGGIIAQVEDKYMRTKRLSNLARDIRLRKDKAEDQARQSSFRTYTPSPSSHRLSQTGEQTPVHPTAYICSKAP